MRNEFKIKRLEYFLIFFLYINKGDDNMNNLKNLIERALQDGTKYMFFVSENKPHEFYQSKDILGSRELQPSFERKIPDYTKEVKAYRNRSGDGRVAYVKLSVSAKNKEISNLKIVQLVSKQQEESIEEINSKYEEMRKIRHDLKNTVECVEILLDKGKVCEAKEFLAKSVNSSVINTKTYVNTSESLIDAVLNNKLALCRELNINADYRILASFAGIDKMSFSVILFNVLDNAIEAEKKIENPYINIEINNFGEYLALIVKNRIKGSVLNTNKRKQT